MQRGKAWRRSQRARIRQRVRGYFICGRNLPPERLGHYARTPTPCSGPCCGNPRRHFGKVTMQERRAANVGDDEQASCGASVKA